MAKAKEASPALRRVRGTRVTEALLARKRPRKAQRTTTRSKVTMACSRGNDVKKYPSGKTAAQQRRIPSILPRKTLPSNAAKQMARHAPRTSGPERGTRIKRATEIPPARTRTTSSKRARWSASDEEIPGRWRESILQASGGAKESALEVPACGSSNACAVAGDGKFRLGRVEQFEKT